MCTKGAEKREEEEEEEEIMTAVRPLFLARVGGRSVQAREEKDGNEPQIPKVPKLRRGKGRKRGGGRDPAPLPLLKNRA